MIRIIRFFAWATALLASPYVLSAASDYAEITYVFRSFQSATPPDPQECVDIGWPSANEPFANSFDIYSLQSKKANGVVLNDDIKKIGQVITCIDLSGFSFETAFDPLPARFRVEIDGMVLIMEGMGRFTSFDVPEFLVGLAVYSLQVVQGPPEIIGGQLVTNTLTNVGEGDDYVNGSFATLRLYRSAESNLKQ